MQPPFAALCEYFSGEVVSGVHGCCCAGHQGAGMAGQQGADAPEAGLQQLVETVQALTQTQQQSQEVSGTQPASGWVLAFPTCLGANTFVAMMGNMQSEISSFLGSQNSTLSGEASLGQCKSIPNNAWGQKERFLHWGDILAFTVAAS